MMKRLKTLLCMLVGWRSCGNCRWYVCGRCRRSYEPRWVHESAVCRSHEWGWPR